MWVGAASLRRYSGRRPCAADRRFSSMPVRRHFLQNFDLAPFFLQNFDARQF
jgi:hypothetical protein